MGQHHGKNMVSEELQGPTSVHRPAKTRSSLPLSARTHDSISNALRDYDDDPFSRGDCTPGGTLSRPRVHKPRVRVSKGPSLRLKGGREHSLSIGEKLQAFEEMVIEAEMRAVGRRLAPVPSQERKGRSVLSEPTLRRSVSEDVFFGPKSAPIPQQSMLSPIPTPGATSGRPTLARRASSSSTSSSPASIKSSKRAEREWRAKVAALARSSQPPETILEFRGGPVPPKRTPYFTRADRRSASPASDVIITPPPNEAGTPAKSFVSNMSFETLGHCHLSPVRLALDDADISVRQRKASVPRSVVSSFYFDPLPGSRISTRPSSFVATQVLSSIPAGTSPLRDCLRSVEPTEQGATPSKPSCSSTCILPTNAAEADSDEITTPPHLVSALPESTIRPRNEILAQQDGAIPITHERSPCTPIKAGLQVSIQKSSKGHSSTLTPRPYGSTPRASCIASSSKGSSHVTPLNLHAARVTPMKNTMDSIPGTPLSPTTAYLMTAPIDSIDLSRFGMMGSPGPQEHPYSLVPVMNSPARLAQSGPKGPVHVEALTAFDVVPSALPPTFDVLDPIQCPSDPFIAPIKPKKQDKPKKEKRRLFSSDRASSNILQVRKTQPKVTVLGDPQRRDLERQRGKLRKMGIDLTPGLVDGNRPPKSGMPETDLQRWLMQTTTDD